MENADYSQMSYRSLFTSLAVDDLSLSLGATFAAHMTMLSTAIRFLFARFDCYYRQRFPKPQAGRTRWHLRNKVRRLLKTWDVGC